MQRFCSMGLHCGFQLLEGQLVIAYVVSGPYFRRVSITRFLSFLAALALIIAPVAMRGGGIAIASNLTESTMSADHCADMSGDHDKQQPATAHDCVTTCSALTPAIMAMMEKPLGSFTLYHSMPLFAFHGITPEAELPPPRLLLTL